MNTRVDEYKALSVEIQARRRDCACCNAVLFLPIHPGGQNLATDDVIDRAIWTHGWAKWAGEFFCPACLSVRPHVRMAMIDDRAEAMAIRVVASNSGWRK